MYVYTCICTCIQVYLRCMLLHMSCDLISLLYVWIRQLRCDQFKYHYTKRVHITVERVGVWFLHTNDFRCLQGKRGRERERERTSTRGKRRRTSMKQQCYTVQQKQQSEPCVSLLLLLPLSLLLLLLLLFLLTIQRMDPVGCLTFSFPLHLVLTVARPKSPIFTVQSS